MDLDYAGDNQLTMETDWNAELLPAKEMPETGLMNMTLRRVPGRPHSEHHPNLHGIDSEPSQSQTGQYLYGMPHGP
ncbi:unnamed protein product [Caretta caretta]